MCVQVRGNPQIGQDCFATFSFMNPISVTLTECEFTIEGPGLVRAQTVKYRWVNRIKYELVENKRKTIGFIEYLINCWIFLFHSPVTWNPERWSVSPVHSAIQRWAQTGRIFQFPRIGWHYRLSPDSCPWLRRRHQTQQWTTQQKLLRHYYDLDLETNLNLPMEQCCNLVK